MNDLMILFGVKHKLTISKPIKKLDNYGFVYTEKKGRSNFYHINKNLSWRRGKLAREALRQNKDMYTRFEQFQADNTKEIKAIKNGGVLIMKKPIKYHNFDKISSSMARDFGTIKKGDEESYNFILFPMESNLLKANRIHQINNGRRVIEAIHICLFVIDGYLKQIEYELNDYITNENADYVKSLLMGFDPFTNEEILTVINQQYDLSSIEDLEQYFATPIKCLIRIEKSVELWTKEYGLNGYFTFLEQQIGQTVEHDDKMNFTISVRRK